LVVYCRTDKELTQSIGWLLGVQLMLPNDLTIREQDCLSQMEGSNGLTFDRGTSGAAVCLHRAFARGRDGAEAGV
jgi:hypothetical protein